MADWGVFQIGFTGGEPTLRKDIVELAKYVCKNGCVFNLTTNGWFLDEELVSKLISAGMKQCQVSMDSHIPAIHDALRGKGSCEKVMKSIQLLKSKGVAVGIDCVVSKNNIKLIPDFIEWIRKENLPYLTLLKLKKGDLSQEDFLSLSPSYEEYSGLIRHVCSRGKNENPNITLDCGSVSNLQAVAEKKKFENIPTSGCPIGHHLICIAPNGDVYACAALLDKKFCLGNALTDNLEKIWTNNSLLKNFRLVKKKIIGRCGN
ncbi:MAG: radical SAM protein, partial [DPANN group archaeon]|nr:radical SAM protein [DPANN group archaeon]